MGRGTTFSLFEHRQKQQLVLDANLQVVRYSALLGGIAYGFMHNRTVQKEDHEASVRAGGRLSRDLMLTL